MTFDDLLKKYRDYSSSERDKGIQFEHLMRVYLLTDPKYSSILKNVWLWNDFFARKELGTVDTGIDIVAETFNSEFWAIQCKCYAETSIIDKSSVDTFLSTSGRKFNTLDGELIGFSQRIFISTSDNWTENANDALSGQSIPVTSAYPHKL
jgi:predicted helicase